jgi:hypothetical protein
MDGVIVAEPMTAPHILEPDVHRYIAFTRNANFGSNPLWRAGVRHLIHADCPPRLGCLAIIAAERKLKLATRVKETLNDRLLRYVGHSGAFDSARDELRPLGFRLKAQPRALRPVTSQELAFLIHFVGDIHQPLHAATDGDRGGNCVALTTPLAHDDDSRPTTELHAVWDVDEVLAVFAALGDEDAADLSIPHAGQRESLKAKRCW